MHNLFGDRFSFFSFGESHSSAIGGIVDGVRAGTIIDIDSIRCALDQRAGRAGKNYTWGQTPCVVPQGNSARALREKDEVEWLSGVVSRELGTENRWVALGTPIAFLIRNSDARPEDYEWLRHSFRPGHADSTYQAKYGVRDWRGGGRASARETAARVVAGELARQQLRVQGIQIHAEAIQIGAETRPEHFNEQIQRYAADGDSIGGIVRCTVTGLPAGLGDPLFDKIQSHLAYAMLSINACKGFDYGSGFEQVTELGSIANQESGGLLGGITDGSPLVFRCVFKPTPTTHKAIQQMKDNHPDLTVGKFRSDACVVLRAVAVVEAMTALVLANFVFEN